MHAGLLWSAWPLFRERLLPGGLPPDSQRGPGQDGLGRRPPKRPPPTTRDSPWGVASFVSLIPGFGALAWVLPALEAETQSEAATYYLLAAVYSAPVLRSGLDLQDPFLWAMYVACVVHVQVERAAKGYDL